MGAHIVPEGWREWHPGETAYLPSAFYAEYGSSGPGAAPSGRQPHAIQLTQTAAVAFEPKEFLSGNDGWNPNAILDLHTREVAQASLVAR